MVFGNFFHPIALAVSGLTYWQAKRQFGTDYDAAVIISPGVLPIERILEGERKFSLDVSNTAKGNVGYFLRVASNMGCVKGSESRPQLILPPYNRTRPIA
jgi:hypothetical protein